MLQQCHNYNELSQSFRLFVLTETSLLRLDGLLANCLLTQLLSKMSLDTLFQQILLTEQQLAEQTQKIKDGKFCLFLWICFFFFLLNYHSSASK